MKTSTYKPRQSMSDRLDRFMVASTFAEEGERATALAYLKKVRFQCRRGYNYDAKLGLCKAA